MSTAATEHWGASSGTAYVYVHGTPGSVHDWHRVVQMRPDLRHVIVELPDHGSQPEAEISEAGLEDCLGEVLHQVDAPALRVVALSFGAYLLARVLARLGDHVEHATLVSGLSRLEPEGAQMRHQLYHGLDDGSLPVESFVDQLLGAMLGTHRGGEVERKLRSRLDNISVPRWKRHIALVLEAADETKAVSPYDTPATALHARDDQTNPLSYGRALADQGRRSALVAVETDSHMLPLTHPQTVARYVFGGRGCGGVRARGRAWMRCGADSLTLRSRSRSGITIDTKRSYDEVFQQINILFDFLIFVCSPRQRRNAADLRKACDGRADGNHRPGLPAHDARSE